MRFPDKSVVRWNDILWNHNDCGDGDDGDDDDDGDDGGDGGAGRWKGRIADRSQEKFASKWERFTIVKINFK